MCCGGCSCSSTLAQFNPNPVLRPKRDARQWLDALTGNQAQLEPLGNNSQQQHRLHRCEPRADADAWTTTKRQICKSWQFRS